MNRNRLKTAGLMLLVALTSAALAYTFAVHRGGHPETPGQAAAPASERKILYWYDPMVPDQHFDKPGKSPFMDMQLVPRYADENTDAGGVKIDPRIVQNLGVRLATVERAPLSLPVLAPATVQLNERQVAVVQARSAGFVERVYARAPGDVIARGAPLADILVPDWLGAQQELLAVLAMKDAALAQAARERLKLLGMPPDLIARVEKSGRPEALLTVRAPIAGLIQSLEVRAGMTVDMGMSLARINGLDPVWLDVAIPEARSADLSVGMDLTALLNAYPGETFAGKVAAILPEAQADSRTVRLRAELPNRDGRLRPGMFAQVKLEGGQAQPALLVPSEAIIRTGTRDLVLLALDDGAFQPVEIKAGREAGDKTEVLAGVDEGQRIVASGQFLIDSEASLRGIVARLNGKGAASASALHEAEGTVEAIAGTEITLSHGPVQSLGWGAMTMPFTLANVQLAAGLKPGDRVSFAFREQGDAIVIEKLSRSGGQP